MQLRLGPADAEAGARFAAAANRLRQQVLVVQGGAPWGPLGSGPLALSRTVGKSAPRRNRIRAEQACAVRRATAGAFLLAGVANSPEAIGTPLAKAQDLRSLGDVEDLKDDEEDEAEGNRQRRYAC